MHVWISYLHMYDYIYCIVYCKHRPGYLGLIPTGVGQMWSTKLWCLTNIKYIICKYIFLTDCVGTARKLNCFSILSFKSVFSIVCFLFHKIFKAPFCVTSLDMATSRTRTCAQKKNISPHPTLIQCLSCKSMGINCISVYVTCMHYAYLGQ